MAKRFGGKYSPQGAPTASGASRRSAYAGAKVDPVGARANLMFLPAVVLLFMSLTQGALGLALGLAGTAALGLGAWLLRGGLVAEAAWHARKVARRPAMPRKIAAALMAGIGTGLAALSHDGNLIAAVLFGAAAGGLHLAAFGIDPLSDKGMEGIDTFQQDRVARVVDEAEAHLTAMTDALKRAGDRRVTARMEQFQTVVRDLIRTVEDDPRDLTAARKYLGVYLLGARDASVKFADIYARNQDEKSRSDYLALLDDLEENFTNRTTKLMLDDHSDLTVEIEVLRDRLQREGVRLD
ncbi:5-bromo-4-chloroindolyl phosphate hydrolysis family protein [Roseobacter sinensis]|uniref:5-bromo-4-chloroindolyl phosphate hydrolysis family protein n=1 Tax=Roseobacter sinensis TaxID=2931391 RepID=A0ABT3BHF0_9RHOB|nr:5-bromo-4-chloroindolyl phosphate hydrolysis family protein [Roseobacter sp. WL0113]MCV3273003.1 5-bromo-4-chloroindolyl phosphate hydrolysis family protein [Roseobacter sp. WL0113]